MVGFYYCVCVREQGQMLCGEDYKRKYEVLAMKMYVSLFKPGIVWKQSLKLAAGRPVGAKDDPHPSPAGPPVMAQMQEHPFVSS